MCHPVCFFFCSAYFPTLVCIWCQRLFVAEDLLQNTLKNDSFLERTLLCCCTEHKTCYPHLIPSFLVSVMTQGLSHKAGLLGRKANFDLTLTVSHKGISSYNHTLSRWFLMLRSKSPTNCFRPGFWINTRSPPHQSIVRIVKSWQPFLQGPNRA